MNLQILFLGQIPEAIFFALFLIFTKNIKQKRILFTILMIVEYLLLMYAFPYNWTFHILYMILTFITLKVLYREKCQITDLFILAIAYIYVVITSILCMFITHKTIIATILNRFVLFIPLFILRYKLVNIQNVYKKYWNRNDKVKKKVKSTTFRSINIVIFNLMFYVINFCMLYAILFKNGGV